ncbi:YbaK/EbsC family protein [Candidatus Gracilibacteria bacterium]|nr:YbaK/EbsC family protein [Candidatus Gracilibacteria bacterium]
MDNYRRIKDILEKLNIRYDEIEHAKSNSCEDSKKFRNEKGLIGLGSKNIIFHCKANFYLVTTYGDKQIKARNFKHEFGSKDIRFATQDEITSLIGSVIGSIPPYGFENENVPIYVDSEIFESDFFIFNPSIATKSIRISTLDLKKVYENLKNPIKYFIHKEEEFEIC